MMRRTLTPYRAIELPRVAKHGAALHATEHDEPLSTRVVGHRVTFASRDRRRCGQPGIGLCGATRRASVARESWDPCVALFSRDAVDDVVAADFGRATVAGATITSSLVAVVARLARVDRAVAAMQRLAVRAARSIRQRRVEHAEVACLAVLRIDDPVTALRNRAVRVAD